ncbi:MAG TPA: tetratricopeptide repeat protein [Hypericibacter adhaerens]|uniref:tetratricopeptide repeat-containing glycosyltransferase family protein n=1 Tax=Hypericibacter adhaerens TaxID=2602016 RepID=UPI002C37BEE4|nr:tetratricopeptide repeat protein [Hypericibacter adhaerens]HWA45627.1 tetratricopeptide repeat protein [Hypericibacter adhaerens]
MTASDDSTAAMPGPALAADLAAARAHQAASRWPEAVALYRAVLARVPDSIEALSGLGDSLRDMGSAEEAVTLLDAAVARHPGSAALHYSLGRAHQRAKRLGKAIDIYKIVLKLDPHHADALNSLGLFFSARDDLKSGIALFRKALAARPEFPDALVNLGLNLKLMGQYTPALLAFRQAMRLAPDDVRAHWAASQLQLLMGQFEEGWRGYEWRWRTREESSGRPGLYRQPPWDGKPLPDGKLLIWSEQGVGDEVMFTSLLPELSTKVSCLLECDPRLVPLFARSLPGVELVARAHPLPTRLSAPDIRAQSAAGSLGRWLRPDRASFAGRGGAYLKPDQGKRDRCRGGYGNEKLNVGIAWHTTKVELTAPRPIALEALLPILRVPGARFVSLQYGDHREAIAKLAGEAGIEIHQDPEIDQIKSLDDFAAQIAALDLVITIDNSTAHMAGALGVPAWVLLPHPPEWRWLLEGSDCLWWPSLRLFRQKAWKDWSGVVQEAAEALARHVAAGRPRTASP